MLVKPVQTFPGALIRLSCKGPCLSSVTKEHGELLSVYGVMTVILQVHVLRTIVLLEADVLAGDDMDLCVSLACNDRP